MKSNNRDGANVHSVSSRSEFFISKRERPVTTSLDATSRFPLAIFDNLGHVPPVQHASEVTMSNWSKEKIWGWGRYPTVETLVSRPERTSSVIKLVNGEKNSPMLAHGLGRSYGDSALLSTGNVLKMERLNRILSIETQNAIQSFHLQNVSGAQ